jgi:hypothetical protein
MARRTGELVVAAGGVFGFAFVCACYRSRWGASNEGGFYCVVSCEFVTRDAVALFNHVVNLPGQLKRPHIAPRDPTCQGADLAVCSLPYLRPLRIESLGA